MLLIVARTLNGVFNRLSRDQLMRFMKGLVEESIVMVEGEACADHRRGFFCTVHDFIGQIEHHYSPAPDVRIYGYTPWIGCLRYYPYDRKIKKKVSVGLSSTFVPLRFIHQ